VIEERERKSREIEGGKSIDKGWKKEDVQVDKK
jgi:hypothetical protein